MSQGDGLSCRQCASRVVTRSPCKCQRMPLVPGCTELWGADARVPLTFRNCATALRVLFLVSDHLTHHLKIIIHHNHWPKSLSKVKHYIYLCSITTREKMWIVFLQQVWTTFIVQCYCRLSWRHLSLKHLGLQVQTMNPSTIRDERFDWAQFSAPSTTFALYMGPHPWSWVQISLYQLGWLQWPDKGWMLWKVLGQTRLFDTFRRSLTLQHTFWMLWSRSVLFSFCPWSWEWQVWHKRWWQLEFHRLLPQHGCSFRRAGDRSWQGPKICQTLFFQGHVVLGLGCAKTNIF